MNKVERVTVCRSFDELDGVELKNGELLRVKFPNGKEFVTKCNIETKIDKCSHYDSIINSFSFIFVDFNGSAAMVKLAQHEILCERIS